MVIQTTSGGTSTSGTITVDAVIQKTADGGAGNGSTLTLIADDQIIINQAVFSSSGPLHVELDAVGAVDLNAPLVTNGGAFTASGTDFDNTGGTIFTSVGDVLLSHSGNVTIESPIMVGTIPGASDGTASIEIDSAGAMTQVNAAINTGSGGVVIGTPDSLEINADVIATGDIRLNARGDVLVDSVVSTTGVGATVSISANSDLADNLGSAIVGRSSPAAIQTVDGNVSLTGEAVILGDAGNAVIVQANGLGNVAVSADANDDGNGIVILGSDLASLSTSSGDIEINGASQVEVKPNAAAVNSGGAFFIGRDVPVDSQIILNRVVTTAGDIAIHARGDITVDFSALVAVDGDVVLTADDDRDGVGNVSLGGNQPVVIDVSTNNRTIQLFGENIIIGRAAPTILNAAAGSVELRANVNADGVGRIRMDSGNTTLVARDFALDGPNLLLVSDTSGSHSVSASDLSSITGNLSLNVMGNIAFIDSLTTNGTIAVESGGLLAMLDGTIIDSGAGSIEFDAALDITLGRLSSATDGAAISVRSQRGAVVDGGDSSGEDIVTSDDMATVAIVAPEGVGADDAIETAVANLNVDTSSGNSNQQFHESDGLLSFRLDAGMGTIVLVAEGAILDSDTDADVIGLAAEISTQGAGGDVGSSASPIGTMVTRLNVDTSGNNHDQFLRESDSLLSLELKAGQGDIHLQVDESLRDDDAFADVLASEWSVIAGRGIGEEMPIQTSISRLAFDNSDAGIVAIANDSSLEVISVGGLSESRNAGGDLALTASGSVTIASDLTSAGTLLVSAEETAAVNRENIVVADNMKVESTNESVVLHAGDRVAVGNSAVVRAANGSVTIESGLADVDDDGQMTLDGRLEADPADGVVLLDLNDESGATQAATGSVTASQLQLISTGDTGSFALANSSTNDVRTLAGSVVGGVSYADLNLLTIGTVRDISGVIASAGDVSITTLGGVLEVAANIVASGSVTLTSSDDLVDGPSDVDNLSVLANVTVESTSADVALRSGDDLLLDASSTIRTAGVAGNIRFEVDFDNADPGQGATAEIRGLVASSTAVDVQGDSDPDTINLSPSPLAPFQVAGGEPSTSPGDSLVFFTPADESASFTLLAADRGIISTSGGFQPVDYSEIEHVAINGSIVINGTGGDDTLTLDATAVDAGNLVFDFDGLPTADVELFDVTSLLFNGFAGDDQMEVNHPAGAVFAPREGGTMFHGGSAANDPARNPPGDLLRVSGLGDLVAEAILHRSTPGAVPANGDDGRISLFSTELGMELEDPFVAYRDLNFVEDQLSALERQFQFPNGLETIFLANDVNIAGHSLIDSTLAASISFLNPRQSAVVDTTLGRAADVVEVRGLDAEFDANLTIHAGRDQNEVVDDVIRFRDAATDVGPSGRNLDLVAHTIEFDAAVIVSGDINAEAHDDVLFSPNGTILAVGEGGVSIKADADSQANGTGGALVMEDGSLLDGGSGEVTLEADEHVAVSRVVSLGNISVSSSSGGIIDNSADEAANLVANRVDLRASTGVGTGNTFGDGDIDLDASVLNVRNMVTGSVNMSALGDLAIDLVENADNPVALDVAGSLSDGNGANATNIRAATLEVRAGTGIGEGVANDGRDLDTAVSDRLAAETESGSINLDNSDSLSVGTLGSLAGVRIVDALNNRDLTIRTQGSMTIDSDVVHSGGGNITLAAEGDSLERSVRIDARIAVLAGDDQEDGDGNIWIHAGGDVLLDPSAEIRTIGAGQVLLASGTDFAGGLEQGGAVTSTLTMGNDSVIASDLGQIVLLSPDDISLSRVTTASRVALIADHPGIPASSSDLISPTSFQDGRGAVLDGLQNGQPEDQNDESASVNVVAGAVVVRAGSGVGDSSLGSDADIDLAVQRLSAATDSGDLQLANQGALEIGQINELVVRLAPDSNQIGPTQVVLPSTRGLTIVDAADVGVDTQDTGSDAIVVAAAGDFVVAESAPVVNHDGGLIQLTSLGPTSDLIVRAGISVPDAVADSNELNGSIRLIAGRNLIHESGLVQTVAGSENGADGMIQYVATEKVTIGETGSTSSAMLNTRGGAIDVDTAQLELNSASPMQTDGGHVDLRDTPTVVLLADVSIDTHESEDRERAGDVLFSTFGSLEDVAAGAHQITINTTSAGELGIDGMVSLSDIGTQTALGEVNVLAGTGIIALHDSDDVDSTAQIQTVDDITLVGRVRLADDTVMRTNLAAAQPPGDIDLSKADVAAMSPGLRLALDTSVTDGGQAGTVSLGSFNAYVLGVDHRLGQSVIINPATGQTRALAAMETSEIRSLAFDPTTMALLALDDDGGGQSLLRLSQIDAGHSTLAQLPTSLDITAMANDATRGSLYGYDADANELVEIEPSTGAVSPIGPVLVANTQLGPVAVNRIDELAFDSGQQRLIGYLAESKSLLSIEPTTGMATVLVAELPVDLASFTYDSARGAILGVDAAHQMLVSIDLATGVAEPAAALTDRFEVSEIELVSDGAFLSNVLVNTRSSNMPGEIQLRGARVNLDDDGVDAASFEIAGESGAVVLFTDVAIDTEQGDTDTVAAGAIDFGTSAITSDGAPGRELVLDTSTRGVESSGGRIAIGQVIAASGPDNQPSGLHRLTLNAEAPRGFGGEIILNGDIELGDRSGDGRFLATTTVPGNIDLPPSTTIRTQTGNVSGDVFLGHEDEADTLFRSLRSTNDDRGPAVDDQGLIVVPRSPSGRAPQSPIDPEGNASIVVRIVDQPPTPAVAGANFEIVVDWLFDVPEDVKPDASIAVGDAGILRYPTNETREGEQRTQIDANEDIRIDVNYQDFYTDMSGELHEDQFNAFADFLDERQAITIQITVLFDPQPSLSPDSHGIQFRVVGEESGFSTNLDRALVATVVLEVPPGLFGVTATIPTPEALPVLNQAVEPLDVSFEFSNSEFVISQSPLSTAAPSSVADLPTRFFQLRIVSFGATGEEELVINKSVSRLMFNKEGEFDPSLLPVLFRRLPDDRYRLYLIEEGADRLVLDFVIRQGQPSESIDDNHTIDDGNDARDASSVPQPNSSPQPSPDTNTRTSTTPSLDFGSAKAAARLEHAWSMSGRIADSTFEPSIRSSQASNSITELAGAIPIVRIGQRLVDPSVVEADLNGDPGEWSRSLERALERLEAVSDEEIDSMTRRF